MFTGIIQELGMIQSVDVERGVMTYSVKCPSGFLKDADIGGSIAIDGVCQTLIKFEQTTAWFQAIQETLRITTLGNLTPGQKVHLERSAKVGDEIGGHQLSGHVMGTATITDIHSDGEDCRVLICQCPSKLASYLLPKGYIALDGASLTLVNVEADTFSVHLIPQTLKKTHFIEKKAGSTINIEIDPQTYAIVRTVESWLERHYEEAS